MSTQYKRLSPGFYNDSKIRKYGPLPEHPAVFMNWLLTGPVMGILPGCASIGRYGIAEQIRWGIDAVDRCINTLVDDGIMQFDADAPLVWFPTAINYNVPRSPDNIAAWGNEWKKLPDCEIKGRLYKVLLKHCEGRDRAIKEAQSDKKKVNKTKRNSFVEAFYAADIRDVKPMAGESRRPMVPGTQEPKVIELARPTEKEKEKEKDIEKEKDGAATAAPEEAEAASKNESDSGRSL